MSDVTVNIAKLKVQAADYNYIRFCWPDINGIARCKTVSARFAAGFIEDGIGCASGTIAMGPSNTPTVIPEVVELGCPDVHYRPACERITPLLWCSEEGSTVGEILCESYWKNGKIQEPGPRYVARRQIYRLKEMSYKILSSFDVKCMIYDMDSLKPLSRDNDFMNTLSHSRHEKMFYEFDKKMQPMGVDIETFKCDFSGGQFEFTCKPKYGIETADMMFRFKEAMKEMCDQKGYHVTFMTHPFPSGRGSNVAHFKHSLWDKDGHNVFYDLTKPDNLSDVARHFLGGIFKHADGLTALCCPTLNCYRRFHLPEAPNQCHWGVDDDRFKMYRVTNTSEKATSLENRLPSGSCNPYIAMAVTLAAGIDGIENKIEPHPKGDYLDIPLVPATLEESLNSLAQDKVLIEALGKQFIDWFIAMKTQLDLSKFRHHDIKNSIPEEIEAERTEFFKFM